MHARRLIRHTLADCCKLSVLWGSALWHCTKIVEGKQETWNSRLNKLEIYRSFHIQELNNTTATELDNARCGRDLTQIPHYSKTHLYKEYLECKRTLENSYRIWCRSCALPQTMIPKSLVYGKAPGIDYGPPSFGSLTRHLLFDRIAKADVVCSAQDKDTSILWAQSGKAAALRMCHQALSTPDRWAISTRPMPDVLAEYRRLYDDALPRNVHLSSTAFSKENISHIYSSIKSKCWKMVDGTCSHVCTKIGHACQRLIVSFVALPDKLVFRYLARAYQFFNCSSLERCRTVEYAYCR